MLNTCKVQSKPMLVRGRRDLTAPWLGWLGETSPCSGGTRHPLPLAPQKPQCTAAEARGLPACVFEGLQTCPRPLEDFRRMLFAQWQGRKLWAISFFFQTGE